MLKYPRRPISISLYSCVVLTIAAFYLLRLYNSLVNWEYLNNLLPITPGYLALTGLVWGLGSLFLSWSLWSGWRRARQLFWIIFLSHGIYFWLDRFFMPGNAERNANNLFWIFLFSLITLVSFWILYNRKAGAFFVRDYFNTDHRLDKFISGETNE